MMTLDKFEEASEKVKEVTLPTNLIYSEYFSEMTGNKVYLKPENLQNTGAYKVRGAYYKTSTLSPEERAKGLITSSAGNHAQGVANAAKLYGVPAVMLGNVPINRFKYYDWYYSTERYDFPVALSVNEALCTKPASLPDLSDMTKQVIKAFPEKLWRKQNI